MVFLADCTCQILVWTLKEIALKFSKKYLFFFLVGINQLFSFWHTYNIVMQFHKHVIIRKYIYTEILVFYSCYSRCGTLKNPHCPMAMIAEHWSKFAALNRTRWPLHIQWKFLPKEEKISPEIKQSRNLQIIRQLTYLGHLTNVLV